VEGKEWTEEELIRQRMGPCWVDELTRGRKEGRIGESAKGRKEGRKEWSIAHTTRRKTSQGKERKGKKGREGEQNQTRPMASQEKIQTGQTQHGKNRDDGGQALN